MLCMEGRKPKASGQISTPAWEPERRMNERCVAGAVGGFHFHIGLDNRPAAEA